MTLSTQARKILRLISRGHSYEQILSLHSGFTYKDIFSAAQEALKLEDARDPDKKDTLEEIRQRHANAYEPWTREHEELLKKMHLGGAPAKEIAAALQRQPSAIRSRMRKMGLSN